MVGYCLLVLEMVLNYDCVCFSFFLRLKQCTVFLVAWHNSTTLVVFVVVLSVLVVRLLVVGAVAAVTLLWLLCVREKKRCVMTKQREMAQLNAAVFLMRGAPWNGLKNYYFWLLSR